MLHLPNKNTLKWGLIVGLVLFLGFVYYRFNPSEFGFFPKCPFLQTTGLKCAGCGSQRAIHQLLHFNIQGAFRENPLLVLALPYILVGFFLDLPKSKKNPKLLKWRNRLLGLKAIYFWALVVIFFWVGRNVF